MLSRMLETLKQTARSLPECPGVYQFFDKNNVIIYIGKAKRLRHRVLSYFTKHHDNIKIQIMIKRICRIEHIIVNTETDAFLLENILIKKFQPRYNILLKDDKTFPWICIKKESFPRIVSIRNVIKDGSEYFGPFTSSYMVKTLIDFLRKTYYIRDCGLNLSEENIKRKKNRACIEYQIGNCKAPCENRQTTEDYNTSIQQIKHILRGNVREAIRHFKDIMMNHAQNYRFEEAEESKKKMILLQQYQNNSTVVSSSIDNVDVFSIKSDENAAYINYLKVIQGAIVQSYTIELRKRLDEQDFELLQMGIFEIRTKLESISNEIIVPFDPKIEFEGVKITVPRVGEKKKLIDLSEKNARYFRLERLKQVDKANPDMHVSKLLKNMQNDLQLPRMPRHIECFDNSNLQGSSPVAACVVFRNGKPKKSEYRKFHIKTVVGIDDFASMREILSRRYSRMLTENTPLPDLIVIDGGKGQLSAAYETLQELKIADKVSLISIAKRLEEIFVPNDSLPLYINKNSRTLKVIQHLRDESHRFGITFHRKVRSKEFTRSILDEINGIGEKTIEKLLKHYKTIDQIKIAPLDDISTVIPLDKAKIIFKFFNGE